MKNYLNQLSYNLEKYGQLAGDSRYAFNDMLQIFTDNIYEINEFIDSSKRDGIEIEIPEITNEYLNSLLE